LSSEGSVNAVLGAAEQPPDPEEISDMLPVQPAITQFDQGQLEERGGA
jgi:hypothetical protein